jgi:glycosyltransferase involved in cell wall biosynthesis
MKDALLIDAQLFQTGAWDRGMGAYCMSLLLAYAARDDVLPMTFILNKNIDFDEKKRLRLKSAFPDASMVFLDLPTMEGNIPRAQHRATTRLDEYIRINHRDERIHFLILGLFKYEYTSSFPTQAAVKLLVFYDLIPLLRWRDFSDKYTPHFYFSNFTPIFQADVIYAISETTKAQLENELSIPAEKIINLDGATIQRPSTGLAKKPKLPEPYILLISADLPHKNNEHAVRSFAKFNREFGDDFSLVMTSTFSEETQELLQTYSEGIVFTGNITDQELDYYYRHCAAIMLVSYVEGLGLPLLEGVMYNKPVVCSTIDVFEEISTKAFYMADPNDDEAISKALTNAVAKLNWQDKQEEYKRIAATYTWPASAERMAAVLQKVPAAPADHGPKKGPYNFVMPHPATTSGNLGAVVQSLVWGLSAEADIRYWVSEDLYVNATQKAYFMDRMAWVDNIKHLSLTVLRNRKNVYFIDETGASVEVVRRALAAPGICFVIPKSVPLLGELVTAGYMSEADKKTLVTAYKSEAIPTLLEKAGNTVHKSGFLDPRRNNQHIIEDILTKI